MTAIVGALVLPERAFARETTYRVSRFLLLFALFLLHVAGSELIARFYATPYVNGLAQQSLENAQGSISFGPPPGHGGRPGARPGVTPGVIPSPGVQAIGIVLRSALFVLLGLLLWRLLVIFVQFLGGEEEQSSRGAHRNSQYLTLYAWFPLALRRLFEGILTQFQDPTAAWSSPNLLQYRNQSAISFSPLELLPISRLPSLLSYLLSNLTDPFFLWFLFVLAFGGRTVFRLSERAGLLLAGFTVVILALLQVLLSQVGIQTGV